MKRSRGKHGEPSESTWWRRRRRRRDEAQEPTHRPELEPPHDQPWVPTNGLTDRLRRSPRQ